MTQPSGECRQVGSIDTNTKKRMFVVYFLLFIFNSQEGKHSEEELPLTPLAEGQQKRDFSLEIERFHVGRSRKENWKRVTAEWRLLKGALLYL